MREISLVKSLDEVSATHRIRIIRTPVRAPRANAFAERFVGTIRRECLDRMLIVNRRHLELVIREFVDHYNGHRPHRSLGQLPPLPIDEAPRKPEIENPSRLRRADRLGGLIHEYRLFA
jgi:putative transposase